MTRGEFLKATGSIAIFAAAGDVLGSETVIGAKADYAALQAEIDEVTPQDFKAYLDGEWDWFGLARKTALQRLDDAFDKVLMEVKAAVVTDKPAIWLVYNMGVIVKTKETCFSIDLKHRRAPEIAPLLDFALITHNHGDHFTEGFYKAMNGAGKTVLSNFKDKDAFVSHNCAYWCYAYLDKDGWKDFDTEKDPNWVTSFYDKFVSKISDDETITIFEFSRRNDD